MSFWRRREVHGAILLLPYLLVFTLFVLVPLVSTVVTSFTGGGSLLANYRAVFAMPGFRLALLHTAGYAIIASLLVLALAFPTAFVVHRVLNRRRWLRHLLSLPYASGMMGLAMIWLMFFNPQNGLVNKLLPLFGLEAQNWLRSPGLAFVCVLSLVFWRGFGFTLFNCLQAIERQPTELYEFASLAGASSQQAFWHITIPQLLPTLMYIVPTAVVSVLTTFEPVFLFEYAGMSTFMTNTLVNEFYRQANLGRPGIASAIAVLMLLPIMICCYVYMRYVFGRKAAK